MTSHREQILKLVNDASHGGSISAHHATLLITALLDECELLRNALKWYHIEDAQNSLADSRADEALAKANAIIEAYLKGEK